MKAVKHFCCRFGTFFSSALPTYRWARQASTRSSCCSAGSPGSSGWLARSPGSCWALPSTAPCLQQQKRQLQFSLFVTESRLKWLPGDSDELWKTEAISSRVWFPLSGVNIEQWEQIQHKHFKFEKVSIIFWTIMYMLLVDQSLWCFCSSNYSLKNVCNYWATSRFCVSWGCYWTTCTLSPPPVVNGQVPPPCLSIKSSKNKPRNSLTELKHCLTTNFYI